jgi:hypothetical protein
VKNTQYCTALFSTFASLDNLQKTTSRYEVQHYLLEGFLLMVETFESAYPHQVSLSPVSPLLGLLVSNRRRSRPHGICHCACPLRLRRGPLASISMSTVRRGIPGHSVITKIKRSVSQHIIIPNSYFTYPRTSQRSICRIILFRRTSTPLFQIAPNHLI